MITLKYMSFFTDAKYSVGAEALTAAGQNGKKIGAAVSLPLDHERPQL
jgi:hypothetical protein